MNIQDHISESLETIFGFKILKFFDADPDPGSGIFLILYPGSGIFFIPDTGSDMEKFGSGINILDPQHRPRKIIVSFAWLKGWNRSGLIAQGFTNFLHALGTGGNVRGNKQTHRYHRRGRCRWREAVTQGLAVCILGTGSQRRTLSPEGLLEKYIFSKSDLLMYKSMWDMAVQGTGGS